MAPYVYRMSAFLPTVVVSVRVRREVKDELERACTMLAGLFVGILGFLLKEITLKLRLVLNCAISVLEDFMPKGYEMNSFRYH